MHANNEYTNAINFYPAGKSSDPDSNSILCFDFFSLQIFDGYYHFEHRHVQKRALNPSAHHQRRLDGDDRVRWAKQQRAKRRQKRDFRPLKSPYTIQLNDPKWPEMWYLVSRGDRSLSFAAREVDGSANGFLVFRFLLAGEM